MKPTFIKLLGATVFAATLATSAANAQGEMAQRLEARLAAATKKIQDACISDTAKFCGLVNPGEGRLILCMMAHEDQISTKCEFAVYDAARNLERAVDRVEQTADACWPDIEKQCADTPAGGGRIAQCLVAKKASLSPACAAALSKFPAK